MTSILDRIILTLLNLVSSTRRITALYILNFLFCTVVYMWAEHVALIDALWWCVQTWFTVGYGDHLPGSIQGKLFNMYTTLARTF